MLLHCRPSKVGYFQGMCCWPSSDMSNSIGFCSGVEGCVLQVMVESCTFGFGHEILAHERPQYEIPFTIKLVLESILTLLFSLICYAEV